MPWAWGGKSVLAPQWRHLCLPTPVSPGLPPPAPGRSPGRGRSREAAGLVTPRPGRWPEKRVASHHRTSPLSVHFVSLLCVCVCVCVSLCVFATFYLNCGSSVVIACQCRRCRRREFALWVRKRPWLRGWQPAPVFLPGKSHEQKDSGRLQSIGWQSQTQLRMHTHWTVT